MNSASDKQDFLFKIVAICLLLRYNDELKGLADKPNLKFCLSDHNMLLHKSGQLIINL